MITKMGAIGGRRVNPAVRAEVLRFIRWHMRIYGMPPTLREILGYRGHTGPNGIRQVLQRMERDGLVRSAGIGKSRGWIPAVPPGCCAACGRRLPEEEPS